MCTDEDIGWWCDCLSGEHAGSGFRVETKSGMGRVLVDPENIVIKGYID